MTDRELLELAAKAAGIEIYESTDGTLQNRPVWVFMAGGRMGTMPYEERWNPLIDDAQALRLAVKLHIDFKTYNATVRTWVGDPIAQKVIASIEELCGDDPYAATRRAIVRAAVAIGEAQCHM